MNEFFDGLFFIETYLIPTERGLFGFDIKYLFVFYYIFNMMILLKL